MPESIATVCSIIGLLDDGRSPVQTVRGIGYQLILV